MTLSAGRCSLQLRCNGPCHCHTSTVDGRTRLAKRFSCLLPHQHSRMSSHSCRLDLCFPHHLLPQTLYVSQTVDVQYYSMALTCLILESGTTRILRCDVPVPLVQENVAMSFVAEFSPCCKLGDIVWTVCGQLQLEFAQARLKCHHTE